MTIPLSIRLSHAAVTATTHSDFADDGLRGEMHVALNTSKPSPTGVERTVTASIPAWLTLLSWLQVESVTIPGATRGEERRAACLSRAATTIDREFMRLARHPAYRGVAVVGTSTTVFSAVRLKGQDRWWPTIDMAFANSDGSTAEVQHATLTPTKRTMNGRVFTEWVAV